MAITPVYLPVEVAELGYWKADGEKQAYRIAFQRRGRGEHVDSSRGLLA
jgi:hypothetical protein